MNGSPFLIAQRMALVVLIILGLSACSEKVDMLPQDELSANEAVGGGSSAACDGPVVVDMDYIASRAYHHIVLKNCDGTLDAFYGDHTVGGAKDWKKVTTGTRDPDKVWGELLGLAVGERDNGDNIVYVSRRGNGQIHVHAASARNDGIFWLVGNYRLQAEDGADYVDLVDIEYVPSRSQFVILLRKADGTTDAFYGNHSVGNPKDWTRSKGTRDPDKVWGDLLGLAVGNGDNVVYVAKRDNGQIHVHAASARNDGIHWTVGSYRLSAEDGSDYVDLVDIEYTASRSQFVILLRKADGTTDAFYGNHSVGSPKDWTRSKGTRDPDKVWGSIQGISIGLGDNLVYTSDRGADIHAHASQARNDGIHWTVGSFKLQ